MHVTLEQPTGARLITAADQAIAIPATLRYTSADPLAVHLDFPPHVTVDGEVTTWTFARTLLAEGLRAPAGPGSVRVRPCGASHTYVEFHSPAGTAVLRFTTSDLYRFLARTYTVIAPGEETVGAELDQGLVALFGGRV
ncbi:SsgA family sporulation/cell division regulator [Streptomyces sp. ISL-22]|uniref:SsgA family sporulation/cell division regulator n=1 Tax=unclassified Streptomyces TaxID=2593676 RepID=UPI001BEA9527|nr:MULTISPECIES: SsgA family sporulation/cell division regulator [unclassified Streptomyces]MBT2416984.1 SsgA family sporulation/cell division regulator [Streptomyces sp. ISL-24]MBT2430642.1 SsgA family sporulation/cell division regulator [Streptomyces sp. ISL-22]